MTVTDRHGVAMGQVKGMTETERGAIVILEIEGRLICVPQATLAIEGDRARSAQTRSQILNVAGALR